ARGSDAAQAPQLQDRYTRKGIGVQIPLPPPDCFAGSLRLARRGGLAQDFGARLRRRASASTSRPLYPKGYRGSDPSPSARLLCRVPSTRPPRRARSGFRRAAQTPRRRLKLKTAIRTDIGFKSFFLV